MNTINLNGTWSLKEEGAEKLHKTSLPGDVHSTLFNEGVIEDPYLECNEDKIQWVGQKNWIYERLFNVDNQLLNDKVIKLCCESIDTFSNIYINDTKIGETENMFRAYEFDIKKFLNEGQNSIRIELLSAHHVGLKKGETLPFPLTQGVYLKSPHVNLLRKVQCHGGWDWGIAMLAHGVPGDLTIKSYSQYRLEGIHTEQIFQDQQKLILTCVINSLEDTETQLNLSFANSSRLEKLQLKKGTQEVQYEFDITDCERWWPNQYGEQILYSLTVELDKQIINKKIGIREMEVINEKDAFGKSMKVRVNGIDIFCKGANWIPSDAFPSRQTREHHQRLIEDSVNANMNMLRVWGGGQYEKDFFYEICDELGVLVWQDMMFACAPYPSDDVYLKNVRYELDYQVHRLRDHACIALWCGGNELIGSGTWNLQAEANRDLYIVNYDRLNRAVEHEVLKADPTRLFWPTSPCAGPNDFSCNWHDDTSGDMHYWDVWFAGKDFDAYREVAPRFCSEFGFQSFPSLKTLKSFSPNEKDLNLSSEVMEQHQRSDKGNNKIVEMFFNYFRVPNNFNDFIYLSQVQQAIAIKQAVEYWRSTRPICMGALYWQLNDNWPVVSWSSIEHNGNWKQLHYHSKRFFSPLMVCTIQKEDDVEIWVINDYKESKSFRCNLKLFDFSGSEKYSESYHHEIAAGSAKKIKDLSQNKLTSNPKDTFLHLDLHSNDEHFSNTHFFNRYKSCSIQETKIQFKLEITDQSINLILSSPKPSFFVTLESETSGIFSDNSFTLLAGENKEIHFFPREEFEREKFLAQLQINSLNQLY